MASYPRSGESAHCSLVHARCICMPAYCATFLGVHLD